MATRPTIPAPFHPGDRATAPMVLEENTESAWARFEELQKAVEAGVIPAEAPRDPAPKEGGDSYARTVPMALAAASGPAAAPPVAQPTRQITLEEAMLLVRRNNRACPLPASWAAFHAQLPPRQAAGGRSLTPPPPIDGPAWGATSAMQKRLRLRDQIEWADRAGVLQAAVGFLIALPEDQWHHFGD